MKRLNFYFILLCTIMGHYSCSDKDTTADLSNVNGQSHYAAKKC